MASAVGVAGVAAAPCSAALSSKRSELVGRTRAFQVSGAVGVPSLRVRGLKVVASGGKKITTKEPYGPSGGTKWKDGVDASGRKGKGKGIYQFAKKYGANVDGYSPIYAEDEWTAQGNNYGRAGLLLWALTFAALLVGGGLLVYTTSALA